MDGAQVGVLEQTDQVGLASFLQGHDDRGLELKVSLEVLGDFSDKTLEGQLADEQLCGFLVPPDLSQAHGSGPVPVGLLDTSGSRGALAGSLGGELLARSLTSSGFMCSLLRTCQSYCKLAEYRELIGQFQSTLGGQENEVHAQGVEGCWAWCVCRILV